MSAFALSHTRWRMFRCRGSQSHFCRNVEESRRHHGVFSGGHGRHHSTRSRGRPLERAGNRHHAPTVLMESPSSTIHYICRSFLPGSVFYHLQGWFLNWSACTLFLHLHGPQLSRHTLSNVVLQVGQLCRCVRVSKLCNFLRMETRRCNSCAMVFLCDAAWSTQKQDAAPLALIKQESAEDLEAHNVVSLFAPVFVRLHRPTQSDVDVFFVRFMCAVSPFLRRPPTHPTGICGQMCGFCDAIHLSLEHCSSPRRPLECLLLGDVRTRRRC